MVVTILAGWLVMNWLYNCTGGSVLLVVLMHGALNALSNFTGQMYTGDYLVQLNMWEALGWATLALVIIVATRGRLGLQQNAYQRSAPPRPGHLNQERGQTLVIVTHDPAIGQQSDRLIRMQDGQIAANEEHQRPVAVEFKMPRSVATRSTLRVRRGAERPTVHSTRSMERVLSLKQEQSHANYQHQHHHWPGCDRTGPAGLSAIAVAALTGAGQAADAEHDRHRRSAEHGGHLRLCTAPPGGGRVWTDRRDHRAALAFPAMTLSTDSGQPEEALVTVDAADNTVAATSPASQQNRDQINELMKGGLNSLLTILEGGLPGISTARYQQLRAEAEPLIDAVASSILFPTIIRNVSTGQGEPLGFIFTLDGDYDQHFGLTTVAGEPVQMDALQPGVGNIFMQASKLFTLAQRQGQRRRRGGDLRG